MRNTRTLLAALVLVTVGVLALRNGWVPGTGQGIEPPGAATARLSQELGRLRGGDDLVRWSTEPVPASGAAVIYTTTYGRLALKASARVRGLPAVSKDALLKAVQDDAVDDPAWIAFYVCQLATTDEALDAPSILRSAEKDSPAIQTAIAYLDRIPDEPRQEQLSTRVVTASAYVRVLTCLGSSSRVPPKAVSFLADQGFTAEESLVRLAAVRGLTALHRTFTLPRADTAAPRKCDGWASLDASAALQLGRLGAGRPAAGKLARTYDCARMHGAIVHEPQTLAELAMAAARDPHSLQLIHQSLDSMQQRLRSDGLIAPDVDLLGSWRATYVAAQALTAAAAATPGWLRDRVLKEEAEIKATKSDDVIVIAAVCHRLQLSCPKANAAGVAKLRNLAMPQQLDDRTVGTWVELATFRMELQLTVPAPLLDTHPRDWDDVKPIWLQAADLLAMSGHEDLVSRIGKADVLAAVAHDWLRGGRIVDAAAALDTAVHTRHSPTRAQDQLLEGTVQRFKAQGAKWLFAHKPNGYADIGATQAGMVITGHVESNPAGDARDAA